MKQPSSLDEETVRHQFDRKCKLALKGELVDYTRHIDYLSKHEVILSELTERELEKLFVIDEYDGEYFDFQALGYDIQLKDMLLAEALNELTERKREVIMLSYFQGLSDADIARKLNLDRSTVNEHRKRSLELLKQMMEERSNENKKRNNEDTRLLPFCVIKAAAEVDILAIHKVLNHYEGYIKSIDYSRTRLVPSILKV